MWSGLVGVSDEHYAEDIRQEREHEQKIEKKRQEYIDRAKAQREYARQLAKDKLDAAIAREKRAFAAVEAANDKLSASTYQLSEAKASLAKTRVELQRLGNEQLELVSNQPQEFSSRELSVDY